MLLTIIHSNLALAATQNRPNRLTLPQTQPDSTLTVKVRPSMQRLRVNPVMPAICSEAAWTKNNEHRQWLRNSLSKSSFCLRKRRGAKRGVVASDKAGFRWDSGLRIFQAGFIHGYGISSNYNFRRAIKKFQSLLDIDWIWMYANLKSGTRFGLVIINCAHLRNLVIQRITALKLASCAHMHHL